MGQHEVRSSNDDGEIRAFTRAMLADLRALEQMLERGMFETGIQRIGAEQEMALVDERGNPAPVATDVLDTLSDERFTTELAQFNLEANLPPQPLGGGCFRKLEEDLRDAVHTADVAAEEEGASVLLTGILPTLSHDHLSLRFMTPLPRYRQLNDGLVALGEGGFPIYIRGVDELETRPDSVMFEAANTSFQLHLQVTPEDFARKYNLAQLITAPLLAAAVNSPLFLGKRLWHETRMALFERSVDARTEAARARGRIPRVSFGSDWVRESVLELFRDAAARFPVVLTREAEEAPEEMVSRGEAPKLLALMLHNGTVWRWNRACYGVADGVAHLRIENRVLPSGPTVLDEVANAALFYGLMSGLDEESSTVAERLPFDAARGNFVNASRQGLGARLTWLGERRVGTRELLLEELLPVARQGLQSIEVPPADIERYLGTIEERVRRRRTGARWMLDGFSRLDPKSPTELRTQRLTRKLLALQRAGDPVHQWPRLEGLGSSDSRVPQTVGDIMSTDLFTVRPHDVVDLATSLMHWKHFRHVPVESADGGVVGLISHRALLRLEQHRNGNEGGEPVPVDAIMEREPVCIGPETSLRDGLAELLASRRGCLLVTSEDRLVGIATERDFLQAASALMNVEPTREPTSD